MESSTILIAQLYSFFWLSVGLGMLINPSYYKKTISELMKSPAALYPLGLITGVAGLLVVIYHNFWVPSWITILTVLGWGALIKGLLFIVFPKHITFWKPMFNKAIYLQLMGFVLIILGLFLGYQGFFVA